MTEAEKITKRQRENFGHVLLACARRLDELAQARVNEILRGRPLARPSVMRIVPFLSFEGVRPGELAKKLDVSKQAVSQALALLVDAGMVVYEADPRDGRARLAKLTPAGAEAYHLGLDVLASFEGMLADRMTKPSFETTFRGLQRILTLLEDPGLLPGGPVTPVAPDARKSAGRRAG